jgi:hypothetical protein
VGASGQISCTSSCGGDNGGGEGIGDNDARRIADIAKLPELLQKPVTNRTVMPITLAA